MQSLIKTDTSFLNVHSFDQHSQLIEKCIDDIKDDLDVNPPIVIYGKQVFQRRSIGFFSNDSIGYYYSRQLAKSKALNPAYQN